jgi:predicted phosphodiesterase
VRIAVFGDAHSNLPALQAALVAIAREGCDALYHLGDAIAIGPYPAECLDLLLSTPKVRLIMGNHDAWFAHGLPRPQPSWMSDGRSCTSAGCTHNWMPP